MGGMAQVRLSEAPDRGDLRSTNKVLTWHTLTKDEVKQKVKESESRRREQGKKMKKDQEDLEFKWAAPPRPAPPRRLLRAGSALGACASLLVHRPHDGRLHPVLGPSQAPLPTALRMLRCPGWHALTIALPTARRTIASMNHKLSFKRNPRHPPSRPPGGFQGRVEHRYKWGVGKIPEVKQPMKSTLTGDPNIVITVEPPVVQFNEYGKRGLGLHPSGAPHMPTVLGRKCTCIWENFPCFRYDAGPLRSSIAN